MISNEKAAALCSLNIPVVTDEPAELTPEQEALIDSWTRELAEILANPYYPACEHRA